MKITNKFKFIRSLAILLIILYAIFSNVIAKEERQVIQYTVSKNDTIWSVAKQYKGENEDIREYVYEIQKMNNMFNSVLTEGQVVDILK